MPVLCPACALESREAACTRGAKWLGHDDAMSRSRYVWQGLDDPSRVDQVNVQITDRGMLAFGTATSDTFATVWRLDVDAGWLTRRLEVTARGFGWSRNLVLDRSADGSWTARTSVTGDVDLPDPGLDDPGSVIGAQDCDLGLCPLTNTMPIRRLGLLDDDVPETRLTMAWVDVPSCRSFAATRSTRPRAPAGSTSPAADFHTEFDVDRDGVVIDYPELATRIDDR